MINKLVQRKLPANLYAHYAQKPVGLYIFITLIKKVEIT